MDADYILKDTLVFSLVILLPRFSTRNFRFVVCNYVRAR